MTTTAAAETAACLWFCDPSDESL